MNALRGALLVIVALVIAVVILARGLDDPETTNEPVGTTDTTAESTEPPAAPAPAPEPAPQPPAPAAEPTPQPAAPAPAPAELPEAAPDDMFAEPPPPPAPTHNRDQVRVLVANGSGVCGAAGRLSTSLSAQGYNVLPAVNDDPEGNIEISTIYYVDQYGADAVVVASLIQVASSQVLPLPASPPTAPGDAHVLIHLGADDLAQPNC
ncbi:MAG: LytR C-terminal domain-containing protein [bacterium]|nr:LytR C-terminal domain-containing protein [bacterium]